MEFMVEFPNVNAFNYVLSQSQWQTETSYFHVRRWTWEEGLEIHRFKRLIWVVIKGIPLHAWDREVFVMINLLGNYWR